VVGWWYTSFISACRNVSRVMPAGMVLATWSMEFDVWPAKVLGSWALLYFGKFPFFLKILKIPYIKTQNDFQINNGIMF
jgi:hypothetical protein